MYKKELHPLERFVVPPGTYQEDIVIEVKGRYIGLAAQNVLIENVFLVDATIYLINCSFPVIDRVHAWVPGETNRKQTAIVFESDTKANNPLVSRTVVNGYGTAVRINGDIEGGTFSQFFPVGVWNGIKCSYNTWTPSIHVFGGHFNVANKAFVAPLGTQAVIDHTNVHHVPEKDPIKLLDDSWLNNRVNPLKVPVPVISEDDWRHKHWDIPVEVPEGYMDPRIKALAQAQGVGVNPQSLLEHTPHLLTEGN